MSHKFYSSKLNNQRRKRGRSLLILLLLLLTWSILLGWSMSWALGMDATRPIEPIAQLSPSTPSQSAAVTGTVDPVPQKFQLGQELYLENCSTCHIAVPPAVLPSETWRRLLLEPKQHFGTQVPPIISPSLLLIWDYLRTFSRPHFEKESVPYRLSESRYLTALHPRVKLPQPIKLNNCASCHPGTDQFNFRRLTSEWENSP